MPIASASDVRFARIVDTTGRHVVFMAVFADGIDTLVRAWNREADLTATEFDFGDSEIFDAARARLFIAERESGGPSMFMVGSTEGGHWVNWNLRGIPAPSALAY